MLRPGMWRHDNCLDIDVYITKVQYRGPKYSKVKVIYWNRHYKFFYNFPPETVKINRNDFKRWSVVV